MNRLFLLSVLFTSLIFMPNFVSANGVWQCFAFNERHQSYEGWAEKRIQAKDSAKKVCQKVNKKRQACTTADSFCYNINRSIAEQECVVIDKRGKAFLSPFCKTAVLKCELWQYWYGMPTRGGCIAKQRRL